MQGIGDFILFAQLAGNLQALGQIGSGLVPSPLLAGNSCQVNQCICVVPILAMLFSER